MLTALRRQIQPVLLRTRIQRLKHRLPDLLAGIRSELTVVNFTRRTSHYQNLSRFHLRRRNQLLCDGTRFLSDCFKIHFVSLLAKQQYLCKRRLTLFPRISLLSSAYIILFLNDIHNSSRYVNFFYDVSGQFVCNCLFCSGDCGLFICIFGDFDRSAHFAVDLNSDLGYCLYGLLLVKDADKETAIAAEKEAVADKLTGNIVKEIYVPGRIVNIVQK